ncbi:MAG TPA: hypothetical protein VGR87_04675 [Candidatus Limnocylindria bacterium]|nr:hypothetical protein [Candidatus Limnocylindria bacterium]
MIRRALVLLAATALVTGSSASADSPKDSLHAAVKATAGAKTARIAVKQRVTTAGRTSDSTAAGVLAVGDQDLVLSGEGGGSRRIAVGTKVKERRPDAAAQPWHESARNAPTQTSALGPLTLSDGTSIGDPRLYASVTDAGTDALPQGPARKLVGELDMAAVATAMQVTAAERARMATWTGTLTLWVGADGKVAKNSVRIVIPSASGGTTIEAEIALSDLDAPLTVGLP